MKKLVLVMCLFAVMAFSAIAVSCTAQRTIQTKTSTYSCKEGRCDTVTSDFTIKEQYKGILPKK